MAPFLLPSTADRNFLILKGPADWVVMRDGIDAAFEPENPKSLQICPNGNCGLTCLKTPEGCS